MQDLKKQYEKASNHGPLDIRKEDLADYLDSVCLDLENRLRQNGFFMDASLLQTKSSKGARGQPFTVGPDEADLLDRRGYLFTLEIRPLHQKSLLGIFRGFDEQAERAEVSFKLHTPNGKKVFHYGLKDPGGQNTTSRPGAREACIHQMATCIVENLAQRNLQLKTAAKGKAAKQNPEKPGRGGRLLG